MADKSSADPNLIPAAVGPEDSRYNLRTGYIDYQANYLLINDNLTDFTHLSYVHPKSFGTSEEFARSRPTVTLVPRGIRVQRWVLNAMTDNNDTRPERGAVAGNELWQTYDFLAPGILLMYNAVYQPGTSARLSAREPPPNFDAPISSSFTSQAVTPMSEFTSRYFFSWGPNVGEGSDAIADGMMAIAQIAFGEDKTIIEAQQRTLNLDPQRQEVLTSSDAGPMRFRRVLNDLIAAERGSPSATVSA
jgi:vanillate O-demethylase monooxygenase subunit